MVQRAIERLRAEFLEMPGLQLTVDQTTRLCGIDRSVCTAVLELLVDEKFLYLKPNGMYARATEGAITRRRPLKVPVTVKPLRRAS